MRNSVRTICLISVTLFTLSLLGCTTHSACTKEPTTVSLLDKEPGRPYQILGVTKISKYNNEGSEWQVGALNNFMRQHAASMGGDAIMNLHDNTKDVSGTVIAYKQILV